MTLLDKRAVTSASAYQVDTTAGLFAYLRITNDSPYTLAYWFDGNVGDTEYIPATQYAENIEPLGGSPSVRGTRWGGHINITMALPDGGTVPSSPQASQVIIEGFLTRRTATLGSLVRNINVGGLVAVAVSNILQGTNQIQALTELDAGGVPTLVPANASESVIIAPTDVNGGHDLTSGVTLASGQTTLAAAATNLLGAIKQYNGDATVGGGVPVLVADGDYVSVTTTGSKTIATKTAPNDGVTHTYRIGAWLQVNNITSPQNVAFQVSYTDAGGTARTDALPMAFSTGWSFPTGSVAIANGHYLIPAVTIPVQANSVITVSYNDPAGTPNDKVSAWVERLS